MNRYSIFVKQYVQNFAAHTFYQTLKDISGSESILSQTQPGFFAGNIKSDDNPNEKVIGFFDVSSVSNKRIFFNFSDLLFSDLIKDSNHKILYYLMLQLQHLQLQHLQLQYYYLLQLHHY